MCDRPNFEEDEQEMDELLKKLYQIWITNFSNISGEEIDSKKQESQDLFIEEIKGRLKTLGLDGEGKMEKEKVFKIEIKTEGDFCQSDLEEVIKDGFDNVGNYDLKDLKIEEVGDNNIITDKEFITEENKEELSSVIESFLNRWKDTFLKEHPDTPKKTLYDYLPTDKEKRIIIEKMIKYFRGYKN
jgi:hypothetical protein